MASFHNDALQTLYSSVSERASAQSHIPLHSPGSAAQKTVAGKTYLYWRVYLASGKHKESSLGRAGDPRTDAALEEKRLESAEMRELAADVQLLRKAGFAAADNSSALTLATLFNAGIFSHGGLLVGSHAFGALLNSLGVRLAANYATEDIDIGSAGAISVAIPQDRSFLDILRDSGVPFFEVPELDPRKPPTAFKARGRPLKVDLLVPGSEAYETKPLPEIRAHATGLPYFGYLVSNATRGFVLGKEHVVPVMMPDPARFAVHKLIVSTLRDPSRALKADKDRRQAMVLIDALMEKFPDWLTTAVGDLDKSARPRVALAATQAMNLVSNSSERARDFLADLGSHS
ncbi:hypothetical protein SAMN05444679_12844 [Variovorax sp. CF079]|uniref:GSU2403 family nucleotidyltransferase fold protein n=1 Tax=Variovorax sp. CF079 TaxID=1882774 RepID=UPI0008807EC6|nr:GSU2403 family nucleotidyltransferase fold protein [Variovorax sp. CF079]SDE69720.1 hypothetical protein SAMN05444679_12844 [Variovorax sp. CF079]